MEINLLPQETLVQRYQVSISTIGIYALSVLTVVFSILTYLTLQDIQSKQSLEEMLLEKNAQTQQSIAELQKQVPGSTSDSDNHMAEMAVNVIATVHNIRDASKNFADVRSISINGSTIAVNGHAKSLNMVAELTRKVDEVPNIGQVWLSSTQSDNFGVNFTMTMTIGEGFNHS
jgi:cell division protein ZapA (FtsZ GTPase activity inhibitor)